MTKFTQNSKLVKLLGLIMVSASVQINAAKNEAKKPEQKTATNSIDQAKEALTKFMRIQMPRNEASEAERKDAYQAKLEEMKKLSPIFEEWRKRVSSAATSVVSAEEKKEFESNLDKVTTEAIAAAEVDLKATKPSFTKAEALRKNISTAHRIVGKTKEMAAPAPAATTSTSTTVAPAASTSTSSTTTTATVAPTTSSTPETPVAAVSSSSAEPVAKTAPVTMTDSTTVTAPAPVESTSSAAPAPTTSSADATSTASSTETKTSSSTDSTAAPTTETAATTSDAATTA